MKEKSFFGVMVDASNNAVMRPDEVKRLAGMISKLGYNMLQLYTEDTYEVTGEPYFGYLRGGYSKADLKEIDAYCRSVGVELIPCVQTLAHLSRIFRWEDYGPINDLDDVLLIGDERTYELIGRMFDTLAECFTSRVVNIGLDEAHRVGLGKYLSRFGHTDRLTLLLAHIARVKEIAASRGFRCVMWSDMLFRLLSDGSFAAPPEAVEGAAKRVDPGVGLIYWEYFLYEKSDYAAMIRLHKKFGAEVWFAGAVHTYIGFCPVNDLADDTLIPAMAACRDEGVDNILVTLWGGGECSYYLALPALCRARCAYEGIDDPAEVRRRFFEATGEDYDAFRSLDAANVPAPYRSLAEVDFSRYALYEDVFSGYLDPASPAGLAAPFAAKADALDKAKAGSGYAYLFDTQAALLRALAVKCDLGRAVRAAYSAGDKAALSLLADKIRLAADRIADFYEALKTQWLRENTPHGLDITEHKLGGLMLRLRSCAGRLDDYVSGKIAAVEELDTPLLPHKGEAGNFMDWKKIISVNVV